VFLISKLLTAIWLDHI